MLSDLIRKVGLMIGRRSFAMSGGAAAIGVLTGAKTSANPLATPQAGDVILFAGGPAEVAVAGVLRPLTKTEASALTGGAAAVWANAFSGSADIGHVLVSEVLAIVPFQWRKSSDLGAVIGLPNPNIAGQ
jgi:hypothetical protein